ncbi:MAG: methyltransferase [Lachnospiraceae bacterium]|nr:methyltransferase [Lachnospiraceae bacterium]
MDKIDVLKCSLKKAIPFQKDKIKNYFDSLDNDLINFLTRYINVCLFNNISIDYMAESYAFILKQTMKEQMYFLKNKQYRYKKYDDVSQEVYNDREFMQKYMIGLGLSTIMWQNHRIMYNFFKDNICNNLISGDNYLEIGAGHGLFFSEILKKRKYATYDIVDISETSIELTKKMVQDIDGRENVNYICNDFLKLNNQEYDMIVMGEVLEHVEMPQIFLKKCYDMLSKNGLVYVSTCANAPEPDHIYLFSSPEEVEMMIIEAGLKIKQSIILPYENHTAKECIEAKLPINMAYICCK